MPSSFSLNKLNGVMPTVGYQQGKLSRKGGKKKGIPPFTNPTFLDLGRKRGSRIVFLSEKISLPPPSTHKEDSKPGKTLNFAHQPSIKRKDVVAHRFA